MRDPNWGPRYAFGLPGLLMFVATVIFWLGRKRMVHIPPAGLGFLRDLKSKEGLSVLGRVWTIYVFTMIFWALWDQSSGGEWTIQCQKLDLQFLGITFLPERVQVVNGIFILAMIPLFNYWLYPAISRVFPLTPLRKIGIGLFLTALSFVVIWAIQLNIDHGGRKAHADIVPNVPALQTSYWFQRALGWPTNRAQLHSRDARQYHRSLNLTRPVKIQGATPLGSWKGGPPRCEMVAVRTRHSISGRAVGSLSAVGSHAVPDAS